MLVLFLEQVLKRWVISNAGKLDKYVPVDDKSEFESFGLWCKCWGCEMDSVACNDMLLCKSFEMKGKLTTI